MSEVIEQESTELVTLPPKETALTVYSTAGGLDPLIEQIRNKVAGTVYDMATAKGRDECRSDAAKIAKSKTAIERLGKELSAQYKEIPKKIDAERKRAFDALEALQKEVRQPLTDWEQAEESRIAGHKDALESIVLTVINAGETAEQIRAALGSVEQTEIGPQWEEFEAEAARAKDKALETLTAALTVRQRYEAEQAELARLRAEAAERERKDREAEIARQAEERIRKEAEQAAQAERDAAAKREADAKAAADRREIELKLKAETAERERLEAVQRAEREAKEAIERQRQAELRAESEAIAAAERATQAAEAARLAEVKRQDDEREAEAVAQRGREADIAHKTKLMSESKQALMSMNITEELARAIVLKIVRGEVPNVTINF